ncbi:DUF1461 domain-containing protein [Rubritalea tangerina]|uniref:DUF1461 domain-containing protein n=1 Tax=Rubritalea tangerina TaxID=430798 RepID=A0ABW4Z7Y6_9BACT
MKGEVNMLGGWRRGVRILWELVLSPIALLVAILGGALLVVASPLVWSCLFEAPEGISDYAQEDGELIAYHLWTEKPYSEVSEELKGMALIPREIAHYEDLQEKFQELIKVVGLGALVGLAGVFLSRRPRRVLLSSLLWLVGGAGAAGVWSLIDWRGMFRSFHWWIFQDDSWILPWSSYSLKLYQYSVWKSAMIWMVVISVVFYLVLFIILSIWRRVRSH